MAYSKQTWDTTSYVNPTRMNHIEDGIYDNAYEIGNNTNGRYIKFNDGTLICYKSVPVRDMAVNNSWGALYESNPIDLGDFPYQFYGTPTATVASVINGNAWLETLPTNSSAAIGLTRMVRPTTATISADIQIIAIGRWKA